MRRIRNLEDVEEGLAAICSADPRLAPVRTAAGPLPLRLSEPGFDSLVTIVVAQQVSRASAAAMMGRLRALIDPLTPEGFLAGGEGLGRAAGLSRSKQRAIAAVSRAVVDGRLPLAALGEIAPAEAIGRLTALPGIGPWTAEVYLLFAAGHPDLFPARDVALQVAVAAALGLPRRPTEKELAALAESWSPWRGVASRLFWAYYSAIKGKEAVPLS